MCTVNCDRNSTFYVVAIFFHYSSAHFWCKTVPLSGQRKGVLGSRWEVTNNFGEIKYIHKLKE